MVSYESIDSIYKSPNRYIAGDDGHFIGGAVAYKLLPVSALPEVDYPTIQVVAFYPGASPEVVASSVTAPLSANSVRCRD